MRKCIVRFVTCCAAILGLCVFSAPLEAREVRTVVDFIYTDARDFSEGLAAVKSNDLWGYIAPTGRIAIPFAYKVPEVGSFSEGFAFVGNYFIDTDGKTAFDGKVFEQASLFSEGVVAIQTGGQGGFIDTGGKFVVPPSYEAAGDFSGGLAPVKKNGLWGFIDTQGRMLIAPRFLRAAAFLENRAMVEIDGKVGYIDRSGRFSVQPRYDEGGAFGNSLAPVRGPLPWNDWGYIDLSGRETIPRQFSGAGMFRGGLAPVATEARWGYITVRGNLVLDALYDNARPFSEGLAAVERDNRWGYIRAK